MAREFTTTAARIPVETADAFKALADRLGLAPGTLLRYLIEFAIKFAEEVGDEEAFLQALLEERGGERDGR